MLALQIYAKRISSKPRPPFWNPKIEGRSVQIEPQFHSIMQIEIKEQCQQLPCPMVVQTLTQMHFVM